MHFPDLAKYHYYWRFINVLEREPEFKMCDGDDGIELKNMKKTYQNKTFGGSIFSMEGRLRNPLKKNLYEVRNLMVGYFDLRNVRISDDCYVDI